ncbi:MAG TPA: hypothetical protein VFV01_17125 [Spirillospora sp.]|nr:hypothetical protein [Spirillospora sp.]
MADGALTWDVYGCICGLKANPSCPAWIGCNRGEAAREAQQANERLRVWAGDVLQALAVGDFPPDAAALTPATEEKR